MQINAAMEAKSIIEQNFGTVKNLSSAVMGLSGVVKNAILNHSVISDICNVMPSRMKLWNDEIQVDRDVLCGVADRVLARTEAWTLDSASEAIAQEYDFEVSRHNQNAQVNITESGKVNESASELPQTKNWMQIEWKDEEGNTCLGWVQNYKVTEFKYKPDKAK